MLQLIRKSLHSLVQRRDLSLGLKKSYLFGQVSHIDNDAFLVVEIDFVSQKAYHSVAFLVCASIGSRLTWYNC